MVKSWQIRSGQLLKIKHWPCSVSSYFRVCVSMNILFNSDKQMKNEKKKINLILDNSIILPVQSNVVFMYVQSYVLH